MKIWVVESEDFIALFFFRRSAQKVVDKFIWAMSVSASPCVILQGDKQDMTHSAANGESVRIFQAPVNLRQIGELRSLQRPPAVHIGMKGIPVTIENTGNFYDA